MSETDRQKTLKKHFSSYKGNSRKGNRTGSSDNDGSAKLAAHKAATAGSGDSSNKANIKEQTEEERKANQLISDSVDRAKGVNRTKQELSKNNQIQGYNSIAEIRKWQEGQSKNNKISESQAISLMNKIQQEQAIAKEKEKAESYSSYNYKKYVSEAKVASLQLGQKKDELNEKISSYIPSYEELEEKQSSKSKQINNPEYQKLVDDYAPPKDDTAKDFTKGMYNEIESNPVGVGVTTASMFVGGAAFKVGSVGAKLGLAKGVAIAGTGSKLGKGITMASSAIEPTLAIGGIGLAASELQGKNAEEIGQITPHLIGGIYGGVKGWNAGSKVVGNLQTLGRTEIPLNKITNAEVVNGKQKFPLTKKGQTPDKLVAEFKADTHGIPTDKLITDKYGVWHATPEKLPSKIEILNNPSRPTDVGGLYVSPRVSPAFTRISANKGYSFRSLFQSDPIRPSVTRVYVKDVNRLPTGKNVKAGQEYLSSGAKQGEAYLTPNAERLSVFGKVESEAVISPKTMLKQTGVGKKYYTKINGRKVPIDTFEVFGTGKKGTTVELIKGGQTKTKSTSEIAKSSFSSSGSPLPKIYPSVTSIAMSSAISSSTSITPSTKPSSVTSSIAMSSTKPSSTKPSSVTSSSTSSTKPSSVTSSSTSSTKPSSKLSATSIIENKNKKPSIPEKKKIKKVKKKENSLDWEYKRTTNQFVNPSKIKINTKGLI